MNQASEERVRSMQQQQRGWWITGMAGLAVALAASATGVCAADAADAANPAARLEAPTVEVVGTTPLPGVGVSVDRVPANVYAATDADLRKQQSFDLSEFLDRNLSSVNLNSGLANNAQPDLNYRGFTGSPLLGIPQGISVYVDGVRVNEAFGDVVNWDLIPHNAISSINLIPGSNPVFGLNTLGGAVSITTKSGREYPGGSVGVQGGSWGRGQGDVEFGSRKGDTDFFVSASGLHEGGWRDHTETREQQLFGKVGYQTATVDIDLSYSFANNYLEGTQVSPLSLLFSDPKQAFTWPDSTRNRVDFFNLRMSQVLPGDRILAGNVYYRNYQSTNFNSNLNDCSPAPCVPSPQASNIIGTTRTLTMGGTVEYTSLAALAGHENKWTVGASYDNGRTQFTQTSQDAVFTADRDTVGIDDFTPQTSVSAANRYLGLYATDTYSLRNNLHLTLSGRFNRAEVNLTDLTGQAPDINGVNTFQRFNPAAGLNYNPLPALNSYVSYNEGMRAPTPVELTCANPAAPCLLPNAFLSDPPLRPVVARTWEAGLRGKLDARTRWNLTFFHTAVRDDIEFVSASATGSAGYFQNVPRTRRQGIEAAFEPGWDRFRLRAAYSLVSATYQSPFIINSPNNSAANANGDIQVMPGNRIPGIVRNNLKLRAEWDASERVLLGATVQRSGNQYARGDENNADVNGPVPGYTLLHLDGRWRVTDQLQVIGKAINVFNRSYQTFGALGSNYFTGPGFTYAGSGVPEQFRTPGMPRAVFVGLRYDFDRPKNAPRGADHDD